MAYKILDSCIACDACVPVCPVEAIEVDEPIYVIDQDGCIDCIGFGDKAKCVEVCPMDCIRLVTQ
jgi:ferredoxin